MNDRELSKILRKMDVPSYRTEKLNKNNLVWLNKNLCKRNSQHPKFQEVSQEVETRLKEGSYEN